MVSLVNSHSNTTSWRWHLWEIDLKFAHGLPPGRSCLEIRVVKTADHDLQRSHQTVNFWELVTFGMGILPGSCRQPTAISPSRQLPRHKLPYRQLLGHRASTFGVSCLEIGVVQAANHDLQRSRVPCRHLHARKIPNPEPYTLHPTLGSRAPTLPSTSLMRP